MKALSMTQPWGSLVALGVKAIETRSWPTNYRGPLAIHAAKRVPPEVLAWWQSTHEVLRHILPGEEPSGAVIATCTLVDCIRSEYVLVSSKYRLTKMEELLGDFSPGRWAWLLTDVQPLKEPIPARGMYGLWDWEASV